MSMNTEKKGEEKRANSEQKKLAQSKFRGQLESEDTNPCLQEHKLSNKCMMDNNHDDNLCKIYFENYKACKTFWYNVQLDRRRRRITPELPPADERAKIKADYMSRVKSRNPN